MKTIKFLLPIILILIGVSCGTTKKTEKEKSKEDTKQTSQIKIMENKKKVREVVSRYFDAVIKGKKVHSIDVVYEAKVNNQKLIIRNMSMRPNLVLNEISLKGAIINKVVFDGIKGYVIVQGKEKELSEKEIEKYKNTTQPFNEEKLYKTGKFLRNETIKDVNYDIIVDENGTEYFFNAKTGLLDKEIANEEIESGIKDNKIKTTTTYNNYKEFDEVKLPTVIGISNGIQKMEMILQKAEINTLNQKDFK